MYAMASLSCLDFAWSNTFCEPFLGGDGDGFDDDSQYGYEDGYEDEDEYYLDYCNSNKIVELTIRRDFLLLKLQELVDAETLQQARSAVAAMNRETGNDEHLLKFLVRAGTYEILRARLLTEEPASCPDEPAPAKSEETSDGGGVTKEDRGDVARVLVPILSPSAAEPLLKKLSHYHELRRLKRLESKKRTNWVSIVGMTP
eukprot:CAMPEP_0172377544 /NCGR_PEP_ID=MMETSP1060-20121228/68963_1 /TAXON_ID=37318 /ORGANISM="Pseudo-nitzschia pungens, Strain cf. cingulata" /LENGTH=200 /DNA_ID=CAMNT_0013105237 /DNA_START=379 /DNA_END=981 /DNA_ORIENTATION=+